MAANKEDAKCNEKNQQNPVESEHFKKNQKIF